MDVLLPLGPCCGVLYHPSGLEEELGQAWGPLYRGACFIEDGQLELVPWRAEEAKGELRVG
jgi:hypothetical protein